MRQAAAALVLAFLPCVPRAARAQQTLEVSPPAAQTQPNIRIRPTPAPPPSRQLQEIPQAATPLPTPSPPPAPLPPPPAPSSMLQAQPVLPAEFRGCWEGQVNYLDSIAREYGAPKTGPWTPKTYRICYKRVGSGPFELTFSQVGVVPNSKIVNPTGNMVLISTDGRGAARMKANLHFDEYYVGRRFRGHTFAVDEETILDCTIRSGGAMMVRGAVFGRRDGAPWFRATWHAVFERVESLPE